VKGAATKNLCKNLTLRYGRIVPLSFSLFLYWVKNAYLVKTECDFLTFFWQQCRIWRRKKLDIQREQCLLSSQWTRCYQYQLCQLWIMLWLKVKKARTKLARDCCMTSTEKSLTCKWKTTTWVSVIHKLCIYYVFQCAL
jgi:hypothetical protein